MTFWERTETKKASRKADSGKPTWEDKSWEHALFAQDLPDTFTDRVMLALEEIEIEPVPESSAPPKRKGNSDPYDSSIASQVQRNRTRKRMSRLKVGGATAAIVVLVGSTLLYTQPTLADMVRSLFAKDSYVDDGMKSVQNSGLVQISGVSAKDQGYILKVNEVIADSSRLIIGIDAYDNKGNALVGEIDYTTADFSVHDIQRGNFGDVPYNLMVGGGTTTNRIEFDFLRPVLADKLQLNARIHELKLFKDTMKEGSPISTIKGNWALIIEADLSKAKAQTLLTEINQTYETPGGIQIHMQGATRTPSGGSLEFTTKLTPGAAERAVNGQSGFHKLNFHLEDEQGNLIGTSLSFDVGRHSELERWGGLTQWFYPFNNFAYDKQKIRFVLDSYVIREKREASVTFDPEQTSAEHPAMFEDSGDKLLLEGVKLGPNQPAYIPLGGTANNEIDEDTWVVIDENGKEYSTFFAGGFLRDKYGSVGLSDSRLVIDGLDKMPQQLTIRRLIVNRQYKDADWSFVLPQTGTKGVIPE
ncbi:DUF4179 domain-containing protein [Gorillibacterium timonense]|uniref:DUF4179 domain-containing protein n=1 Tax=Gorillibacterium timonense TaxID=1689269 RepID=UPI00071DC623|nr:DUF4179 domain-containing protein [Gorillibacterium timonense]